MTKSQVRVKLLRVNLIVKFGVRGLSKLAYTHFNFPQRCKILSLVLLFSFFFFLPKVSECFNKDQHIYIYISLLRKNVDVNLFIFTKLRSCYPIKKFILSQYINK